MSKVIKLSQSDLVGLIKKMINEQIKLKKSQGKKFKTKLIEDEDRFGYGNQEIETLRQGLGSDEDIRLSDNSDKLRGDVVKKKDYLSNMLKDAIEKEDWSIVSDAISYIRIRM